MVALFGLSNSVVARDLGKLGPTYPIAERHFIEYVQEQMAAKQASGEVDQVHKGMADRAVEYVKRPPGTDLPRAQEYKVFSYTPMYTLDRDIKDAEGKVLFQKGTTVNPLRVKPLTKSLCFINGDDEAQVKWMVEHCSKNLKNKLILVKGNYQDLTNQLQMRLYFDQRGVLIERFKIGAVPAVVSQKGTELYVEEIPVR